MSYTEKELQWLQNTGRVEVFEINGEQYTTKAVHLVKPPLEPVQTALAVATLTGLVEYLEAHYETKAGPVEDGTGDQIIAHVVGYDHVQIVSHPFGEYYQRHTLAEAEYEWPSGLVFDSFMPADIFNIRLLSLFYETDDLEALVRIAGNIREWNEEQTRDDGVTQEVTVKRGISLHERVAAPPFVELAPFRTFPEVEQPTSRFVFRVRKGKEIECGLFEADGGRWKTTAVGRIKEWLRETLPEGFSVVG